MTYTAFHSAVQSAGWTLAELRCDVPPSGALTRFMEQVGLNRYERFVLRIALDAYRATRAVIADRRVRTTTVAIRSFAPSRDGDPDHCASGTASCETVEPDWPCPADDEVKASPEAAAWLAELDFRNFRAQVAARKTARTDLAARLATI
jgi:hypothetical protein